MRTLIVEDDLPSIMLVEHMLSPLGEHSIARDGQEAVHAFKRAMKENQPYDLVLMDIMMPHMDGQEALKNIREIEKENGIYGSAEAKVIMVTALGDPSNVARAYYKGSATSYIVKPVKKEALMTELRDCGLIE